MGGDASSISIRGKASRLSRNLGRTPRINFILPNDSQEAGSAPLVSGLPLPLRHTGARTPHNFGRKSCLRSSLHKAVHSLPSSIMFASTKRKVIDGLNKRYIYGRVVCFLILPSLSFSPRPALTRSPVYDIAPPTYDHILHRDGRSNSHRGQVQRLLCRQAR